MSRTLVSPLYSLLFSISMLMATDARAASVNLTLTLRGGTIWDLGAIAQPGVAVSQITLLSSLSLGDFTPQSPPVCPPGTCASVLPVPPPDFRFVELLPVPGQPLIVGSGVLVPLGFFSATTGSAAGIQLIGDGDNTALDLFGSPLDYEIRIVPEPALTELSLASVALAALAYCFSRKRSNPAKYVA